jgi:hypothetical protein
MRFQWCQIHKRAYDNIYKMCGGATKKNKDGKAGALTPEQEAWEQIFNDPTNKTVADKVLIDYCAANPDGHGKRGQSRLKFDICSFVVTQGARNAVDDIVPLPDRSRVLHCMHCMLEQCLQPQSAPTAWLACCSFLICASVCVFVCAHALGIAVLQAVIVHGS